MNSKNKFLFLKPHNDNNTYYAVIAKFLKSHKIEYYEGNKLKSISLNKNKLEIVKDKNIIQKLIKAIQETEYFCDDEIGEFCICSQNENIIVSDNFLLKKSFYCYKIKIIEKVKITLPLNIYFVVDETYSKGDYYTPDYHHWSYDDLTILCNNKDVTHIFKEHPDVIKAIFHYEGKAKNSEKIETDAVTEVICQKINNKVYLNNTDITDIVETLE